MQEALKKIAACPDNATGDWKPLSGSPYWRLRVGRYRAICDLQDGKLLLLVVKIGPCGDLYKSVLTCRVLRKTVSLDMLW